MEKEGDPDELTSSSYSTPERSVVYQRKGEKKEKRKEKDEGGREKKRGNKKPAGGYNRRTKRKFTVEKKNRR